MGVHRDKEDPEERGWTTALRSLLTGEPRDTSDYFGYCVHTHQPQGPKFSARASSGSRAHAAARGVR